MRFELRLEQTPETIQVRAKLFTLLQRSVGTAMLCLLLSACSTVSKDSRLLGQNDEFVVVVAATGESYENLAARFLGDERESWQIEDANNHMQLTAGMEVVVPRYEANPIGVFSNGYQVVPMISYHRFGKGRGLLSVSREQFEQQMDFLQRNGYRPISLQKFSAYLRTEKAIPRRSVVLTIDDGHQSVYKIAFPILVEYGFPATVFMYTDYIGKGGLTWQQMQQMEASGLVTFQAHSKTHDNLTVRSATETIHQYRARLRQEVRTPEKVLEERMADKVFGYAYPFGAVNRMLVDELKRGGFELGATVRRGANPFFAFPYTLRRTMMYRGDGVAKFERALRVFKPIKLR